MNQSFHFKFNGISISRISVDLTDPKNISSDISVDYHFQGKKEKKTLT